MSKFENQKNHNCKITTDQGNVAIEKLSSEKHTIRGEKIVAITQSRPLQNYIICFEKNSLGNNIPNKKTYVSQNHCVFYNKKMHKARDIETMCKNVTKYPYNGEILYNVLLGKHSKMLVNNLICETLNPKNIFAKIITAKCCSSEKNMLIKKLNTIIIQNNFDEYNKLYKNVTNGAKYN